MISIHALLAESDLVLHMARLMELLFLSTLSLRRATISIVLSIQPTKFLSTLSLRRATSARPEIRRPCVISIHALLAESDDAPHGRKKPQQGISIHALLAESDNKARFMQTALEHFYPRSPCGERPLSQFVTDFVFVFLSTLSLRRATRYLCFRWVQ